MSRGVALVRTPSDRLAEGVVTHIARTAVDVELARRQHRGYVDALRSSGWTVREVPPAPDCPDSVFVEDTVVVCDDVAVLARPGFAARRAEVDGTEAVVRDLGLRVERIVAPGTLDGGDVLQVGSTVYVGVGGRTNAAGVEQLRAQFAGLGRRVVAVGLTGVLHLKSAVTALPDGTLLARPDRIDQAALPELHAVDEEAGCHVVPLGDGHVLMAASAPRTVQWLRTNGWSPVVVDISEFEKLEGCVTCLTVLVPSPSGMTIPGTWPVVRRAKPGDGAAIALCYEWLFAEPGRRPENWSLIVAARRLEETIAADRSVVLVADDGELVGVATVYLDIVSVRLG